MVIMDTFVKKIFSYESSGAKNVLLGKKIGFLGKN
jgi:hypothetical protein